MLHSRCEAGWVGAKFMGDPLHAGADTRCSASLLLFLVSGPSVHSVSVKNTYTYTCLPELMHTTLHCVKLEGCSQQGLSAVILRINPGASILGKVSKDQALWW